jgi:cyanophycinase
MGNQIKPIYLFADSQLLFWRKEGELYLASLLELIDAAHPKAAYIGASNGDHPEFYSLFEATMEAIEIRDCRMIPLRLSDEDRAFLDEADIILLAGGDAEKGWSAFKENGLEHLIVRRYFEGALLIGISAGAVQLGQYMLPESGNLSAEPLKTFGLVPVVIGAHEEKEEWELLKETVRRVGGTACGIGLAAGSGCVYHRDQILEPIRHPLVEFSLQGAQLKHHIVFPPGAEHDEQDNAEASSWVN